MQKWEYLTILCSRGGKPKVNRAWLINGQEVDKGEQGPTIWDKMNQLGEAGWELIQAPYSHSPTGDSTLYLMFKRPK